jgi:hypothetical protein
MEGLRVYRDYFRLVTGLRDNSDFLFGLVKDDEAFIVQNLTQLDNEWNTMLGKYGLLPE